MDNQNDYVWKNVSITLNKQYFYSSPIVPRGPSSLPLSEFRDVQGAAFDAVQSIPRQLVIEVQEGFNGQPGRFSWR
ncbi:hypothetical protein [Paenibacillus xerothermodurans]|uniref:hypothetical protein n=1 Tax=Paenibacillus xerothermodurans TaxID=1977292 RepID=UPI001402A81B|nr:hypothetical protein [Paenibacillus xerothermodurans]